MSEYGELSEIDLLNAEIAQLKQILTGVKTAKATPAEARAKLVEYCQSKGGSDTFMKADPGMEKRNPYHVSAKSGGGGGGGGDGGGCCVAS
ncbi:hypothetical protein ACHAWF_005461 [Thalassiosira exigua]